MISLLPLDDLDPQHDVGGKALGLVRLAAAGLPVPATRLLPAQALRAHLARVKLFELAEAVAGDVSQAPALYQALRASQLDDAVAASLIDAARALGPRLAVRSSSMDEDGVERSFAGQHASVLDCGPEQVPAALIEVWASLYAPGAMAYRSRGPKPGAMGVVLQAMVSPSCAGVLFTINPQNGSWREMVVEATPGLGERLVSGQVAPHWFVVRRPRRAPRAIQRVLSRVHLQVVQEDRPRQDGRVVRTLDRSALLRLCRLGLKVEAALGGPQDVEWAQTHRGALVLLQARPITTSEPPQLPRDVLWTRRFLGERWPQPATPLGWTTLQPLLDWFIAFPEVQRRYLGGGPAVRLVHSRPYLNATAFRHLLFKLPGAPAPRFMLELIPPSEEQEWRRRFAVMPDVSVYLAFLRTAVSERRWQRFRFNPFTNHLRWDDFRRRLAEELPLLERSPASEADALRLVGAQRALVRDYISVHVTSLLFANLFYQLLESTLASWLPSESRELMAGLASCPAGNHTLQTNEALWELARVAHPGDIESLAAGQPMSEVFGGALAAFLGRFGHRALASWEIFSPRWAQHPAQLAPLLRAQLGASDDPAARVRRQEQAFVVARDQMRDQLRGDPLRAITLEGLVHYTRRYLLLRENQRFWFDRVLHTMQQSFLWLGASMVERGLLKQADDIAFLSWEEVHGVVAGDLPLDPNWVERRRAHHTRDALADPPTFLVGDEAVLPVEEGQRLEGLGISAGRARGRVRVIRDLAHGDTLQPGEILVTRAVDPAWTPLFLTAGGVILELGSLLSHGAVVAREYRVPAVVNLDRVTQRLTDGQEVTVDGTRGVVWLHP